MQLRATLTKENFWNITMEKYPNATKEFCKWVDDYKKAANWQKVINWNNFPNASLPKFHDLPYAMQQGIWIDFANEILDELFEQPEYTYNGDLEEDIKTVFSEIEGIIAQYK